LWSPLFFALHQVWVGLAIITLLWSVIAACIVTFARSSLFGAALYAPYLAWITVAWSLNAWIAVFN
jgi:tryptophan-rich sensory protein